VSVRGRADCRALVARCFAIVPVALLVTLAACSDSIFSPNRAGQGQLQLKPVFSLVDWQSLSANINVIRLTATQLPARTLLQRQETTVDPAAPEWQLPLDLPINSEVEVLVELINRAAGVDVIVYSGRTLINLKGGSQPTAALVPVFPGPPDNLDITSLTITPKNQALLEGDQLQLGADVAGTSNPTVLWSSSNPAIITVDEHGVIHAAGIGQATIQAVAGPKSDNVTIAVGAKATAIQLTPGTATLLSLDDEVAFSGKVIDARNAQLDLPLTYQISDPSIALHTGNGRFRALRSGDAIVTAIAAQNGRTITASATLKVKQTAVSLALTPSRNGFTALGEKQTLVADARDGKGAQLPATDLTWTTSDGTIATVDGNGVVTAVANGNVVVKVTSGALSADAQVVVQQVESSVTLAPSTVTINSGETFQFTAGVYDSRGHQMNVPIAWSVIGHYEIATISSNGLVSGDQAGTVSVTARYNNMKATASLTVRSQVTQIVFDRPALQLIEGQTQQIAAYLADALGAPSQGDPIVFSTADPGIAVINSAGIVSAISNGSTEVIARSQGLEQRLTVTVVIPLPGDIVVVPDLDVFSETPNSPSNRLMLLNLVTFTSNSVRSSGNMVWLNRADAANCAFCAKTFDFMRSEIRATGLKTDNVVAGNGRLTNMPNAVKALFLFVPNGSFAASEIGLLRAFVATGGRLVLLGGHEGAAAKSSALNDLLASLGSELRIGTQSLGCGRGALPASSLRSHQITAGLTDFRPGCGMELLLGSGDAGLIYDASNTIPLIAVTRIGGGGN